LDKKKNILVCPLDWGLGHATRMVPIIDIIIKLGANPIIAADNSPLEFLRQRFSSVKAIELRGYSPKYPTNGNMAFAMIKSMPEMLLAANRAHNELQKIIENYNINAVISDNRYELSTQKAPTIFITHQLNIQTQGAQILAKPVINKIINHYLAKFNEIWIPDITSGFTLSGKLSLSDKFKDKTYNVGLLSRFTDTHNNTHQQSIDLLIILSGPEPQRTIFEKLLISQAFQTKLKTVMLLAKPSEQIDKTIKNLRIISHLPDNKFADIINSAKIIISRPGYSTLMDLSFFNKKAIFIPTPGQTEQEYLANRLLKKGIAYTQSQKNFNLNNALQKQKQFKGLFIKNEPKLLEHRMINLLNNC